MKIKTTNRKAFTLIEMILALGVAAIVLVCITGVLFTVMRLRNTTQAAVDAGSPLDQALTVMRRDLECVVTPTNGTSKVLSGGFRAGNINSLGVPGAVGIEMYTATGALSDTVPWGDIQRVSYGLRSPANNSGPGQDLYRSVVRNLLSVSTPQVDDQFLMSGVTSLKFSAYDGASWNTTWDTTSVDSVNTNLPVAVKVEIQLAANSPNEDPITMVVPIDSVARTNMVLQTTTETGTGN